MLKIGSVKGTNIDGRVKRKVSVSLLLILRQVFEICRDYWLIFKHDVHE